MSEGLTNLKASICRQIILAGEHDQAFNLSHALIDVMKGKDVFLATYACAALVNMTSVTTFPNFNDAVKNHLMASGIASIAIANLSSKDDDLVQYTLVLLVNITKSVHHRQVLKSRGLITQLVDVLTSSYFNKFKHKVLVELSSVL